MSGWFALINTTRPADPTVEQVLADSLRFRGPDGTNCWHGQGVSLCVARLGIQRDGADPSLPIHSAAVVLAGDVRLDEREKLIAKLQSAGSSVGFATGDAALIVEAYREWGSDCASHLFGDYSFFIWDDRKRTGFFARDRMGVKPLFYVRLREGFLFSNTLQCLRRHPDVGASLDELAIADFLMFGENWHAERTFYRDISRLPSAHCGTLVGNELRPRRFWQLQIPEPLRYEKEQAAVEQFREILKRAVHDRIPSDRVGLLMSGGLDSPLLAAMAKRVLQEKSEPGDVRAFCAYHSRLIPDDEKLYAEASAHHLGIPLQTVEVDRGASLYEGWSADGFPLPEPVDNPMEIMRIRLYSAAAKEVRVAVMGFDGDALLFLHHADHFRRKLKQLNLIELAKDAKRYVSETGGIPPLGIRTVLQRYKESGAFPRWIRRDFAARHALRERWHEKHRNRRLRESDRADSYEAMTSQVWSGVLDVLDAGFTGLPLEIVQPLLDMRVVEFALGLPPIPWCLDKKLIRDACCGILPQQVITRPKTTLRGDPVRAAFMECCEDHDFLAELSVVRDFVELTHIPEFRGAIAKSNWGSRGILRPVTLAKWIRKSI